MAAFAQSARAKVREDGIAIERHSGGRMGDEEQVLRCGKEEVTGDARLRRAALHCDVAVTSLAVDEHTHLPSPLSPSHSRFAAWHHRPSFHHRPSIAFSSAFPPPSLSRTIYLDARTKPVSPGCRWPRLGNAGRA